MPVPPARLAGAPAPACTLAAALLACAPPPPAIPTPGEAAVALAAAADSAAPCSPEAQVAEVHNPRNEPAYVSITTTGGVVYYLDNPLAPDEVRRIKLPGKSRALRADAYSEPWRVAERTGAPVQPVRGAAALQPRPQPSTRLEVRMTCAT